MIVTVTGKDEIKEGDVLIVFDYMKFPNGKEALAQAREFGYRQGETKRVVIVEVGAVIPLP